MGPTRSIHRGCPPMSSAADHKRRVRCRTGGTHCSLTATPAPFMRVAFRQSSRSRGSRINASREVADSHRRVEHEHDVGASSRGRRRPQPGPRKRDTARHTRSRGESACWSGSAGSRNAEPQRCIHSSHGDVGPLPGRCGRNVPQCRRPASEGQICRSDGPESRHQRDPFHAFLVR